MCDKDMYMEVFVCVCATWWAVCLSVSVGEGCVDGVSGCGVCP